MSLKNILVILVVVSTGLFVTGCSSSSESISASELNQNEIEVLSSFSGKKVL